VIRVYRTKLHSKALLVASASDAASQGRSAVGMSNPEVMVVLSDDGKPVTVIRALDDDDDVIGSHDQRSSAGCVKMQSADVKRNSVNR